MVVMVADWGTGEAGEELDDEGRTIGIAAEPPPEEEEGIVERRELVEWGKGQREMFEASKVSLEGIGPISAEALPLNSVTRLSYIGTSAHAGRLLCRLPVLIW